MHHFKVLMGTSGPQAEQLQAELPLPHGSSWGLGRSRGVTKPTAATGSIRHEASSFIKMAYLDFYSCHRTTLIPGCMADESQG